MRRKRETQRLVERFASEPGVESEELDFKSKEIVERAEGRQKLIKTLSAMANQNGGTIIIGIRKETDDGLLIQGFPVDSEVVQHLTHTAVEYTNPPVSELWSITFIEYSGKRILRIDIDAASEKPIQYKGKGDYTPWIRVGDGMEQMSSDQMLSFFEERQREVDSHFSSEIEQRVTASLDINSHIDIPSLPSPSNWLITTAEDPSLLVFGEAGLSHDFGKAALYHVEDQVTASSPEDIEQIFTLLKKTAGFSLIPSRFGYTIRLGNRQLISRGHRYFLDDISNIEQVIETLKESHEYGTKSDHVPSDPRPIAVAYVSCSEGIFWLETQWRGGHFSRTKCGFVFSDMPFYDKKYKTFYSELGGRPDVYEQRRGLQIVSISGDGQCLNNPESVDISSHPDAPEYMVVDNPFYHRVDELRQQFGQDLPEYLLKPLNGINRIPLEIMGGYTLDEETEVVLDTLTAFSKDLLLNTLFVTGWCRSK